MTSSTIQKSVEDLAYNTFGIAYDHEVQKEHEGSSIFARSVMNDFLDSKYINPTRTWLKPSTEEQGPNGIRCIWIGMLPIDAANHTASALKKNASATVPKKSTAIGTVSRPILQHQPNALRVVCVLAHKQNRYYALVEEKDGLFEGRRVHGEWVFFFGVFRDDKVVAREKREVAWSKKIKEYKDAILERQGEVTRRRDAKDDQRLDIQIKKNLSNELQGLLANYLRDPREVYLEAMQEAIKAKDGDLRNKPAGAESIINLVDSKSVVTDSLAAAAAVEISVLWPPLAVLEIEPEEMIYISKGLVQNKIVLEYSLIRPFVVTMINGIREHEKDKITDAFVLTLAKKSHSWVHLACGENSGPSPTVTDNDFIMFLDATINNLEALQAYGSEYLNARISSLRGPHSGLGLEQIAEKYADSPDIESAKEYLKEACRCLVMEMTHRDEGIVKHLAEQIQGLKTFRDSLADGTT